MGIHASNNQSSCAPGQSGSPGSVNWGSILGTITNQADLIAYLEANYSTPSTTPAYETVDFGSTALTGTTGESTTNTEIVAAINSVGFTVTSGKLIKLFVRIYESINGQSTIVTRSYDFKKNNISGSWGSSSDNGVITFSDLILRNRVATNAAIISPENAEFIDLGDIGSDSIEDHLNALPNDTHELLNNGTVYYFTCTRNNDPQTYEYVGSLPVSFGNDTAADTDFNLIASLNTDSEIITPLEQDVIGTAIELDETDINVSGEIELDLTTFVSCRIHIDSDDAEIVDTTGRPASGQSFTRYYTLTTENGTEAYTLPIDWIMMGEDPDATKTNCLAVEYSNFPSEGSKIRAYNTYQP